MEKKLYSKISRIIINNNLKNKIYVEPFAGGCGLALKILKNKLTKSIIIDDYDYCYAFWYSILNYKDIFIEKIINTNINLNEWKNQKNIHLNYYKHNIIEVGFSTFFLNRTNYSGILKAGPIGGKNQTGQYKLDCRFNKIELIKKIEFIYNNRQLINLYNLEATEFINSIIVNNNDYFVNFDPPYYTNGPKLYNNFFTKEKHIVLKNSIDNYKFKWFLTYDYCDFIDKLYNNNNRKEVLGLLYSVSKNKIAKEFLIYSNRIKI